jgi:hypothetical protein
MKFIRNKARELFYFSWLILNLLLAKNTGLLDDEAYYWVYSKFMDWGYYDHPPMIAILIKAGDSLFHNELGVRFFIVLMSTLTLYLIDKLCEKRNDLLFFTIAASIFLLQIGSILAVPDLPLMFFIALYFTVLKKFMAGPNWKNSLLLGLVMACMLYSKYHAVLIIFFTLVANPALLRKWQSYFAAAIAFALFLPHIRWQIAHDLPSINYHLFERNATQYQFEFTLQYLISQILLAGPLIGWLVLYAAFTKKPVDPFRYFQGAFRSQLDRARLRGPDRTRASASDGKSAVEKMDLLVTVALFDLYVHRAHLYDGRREADDMVEERRVPQNERMGQGNQRHREIPARCVSKFLPAGISVLVLFRQAFILAEHHSIPKKQL